MRLLLDSHIALWAISRPEQLGSRLESVIADHRNERFVSVASIWELGLKQAKGRISLPADLEGRLREVPASILDVTVPHAVTSTSLPDHHGDPFDRMLVAQAQVERLTLVTADRRLAAYDVDLLTP